MICYFCLFFFNFNIFFLKLFFLYLLILFSLTLQAQDTGINSGALIDNIPNAEQAKKNTKEKDIADLYYGLLKKKRKISSDSLNSVHKMQLSLVPALGYTLQTGFAGIVSANLGFYAEEAKNQKISSITSSFTYSQYHQSIIPFVANIWTKDNEFNSITDIRYIKYPSQIYGLGDNIDPNTGYIIDFSGFKFHQTVLKEVFKNTFLGIGYYFDSFWDIEPLDLSNQNITNIVANKLGASEKASGLVFNFLFDNRINQIYPEQGWHCNISYRTNSTLLGSESNWQSVQADVRTYTHFPAGSKNVLSLWSFDWFTTSKNASPYLMLPSTGWDDQYNTGRGYIQGRFRGKNMFYLESEYRYRISKNGLLGGVLFGNAQYFSSDISPTYNKPIPGGGLGLRLRLNKHSGANLCLDYGFGANNSRGFFVNLGEIF